MQGLIETKLEVLRADYAETAGAPFQYFFCPLLLEDTSTQLCRAHLTNQAFANPNRAWTVQRADVDNFFGALFESTFVSLGRPSVIDDYLAGRSSGSSGKPELYLRDKRVEYYLPKKVVPQVHSEVLLKGESGPIRLALKLAPSEVSETDKHDWQFVFSMDCRLAALVSLLKAAHLTLFEMLGYRYALSAGGLFLGHTILGQFFKQNRELSKAEILTNAQNYFSQYANLVRPVLLQPGTVDDTISGRLVYICEEPSRWAMIVVLRTADTMHATLVPMLDSAEAAVRLVRFLKEKGSVLKARKCQFDGCAFQASPEVEELNWPEANFDCR